MQSVEVCAAAADSRERPAAMRLVECILMVMKKIYEGIVVVEAGKSKRVRKRGNESVLKIKTRRAFGQSMHKCTWKTEKRNETNTELGYVQTAR